MSTPPDTPTVHDFMSTNAGSDNDLLYPLADSDASIIARPSQHTMDSDAQSEDGSLSDSTFEIISESSYNMSDSEDEATSSHQDFDDSESLVQLQTPRLPDTTDTGAYCQSHDIPLPLDEREESVEEQRLREETELEEEAEAAPTPEELEADQQLSTPSLVTSTVKASQLSDDDAHESSNSWIKFKEPIAGVADGLMRISRLKPDPAERMPHQEASAAPIPAEADLEDAASPRPLYQRLQSAIETFHHHISAACRYTKANYVKPTTRQLRLRAPSQQACQGVACAVLPLLTSMLIAYFWISPGSGTARSLSLEKPLPGDALHKEVHVLEPTQFITSVGSSGDVLSQVLGTNDYTRAAVMVWSSETVSKTKASSMSATASASSDFSAIKSVLSAWPSSRTQLAVSKNDLVSYIVPSLPYKWWQAKPTESEWRLDHTDSNEKYLLTSRRPFQSTLLLNLTHTTHHRIIIFNPEDDSLYFPKDQKSMRTQLYRVNASTLELQLPKQSPCGAINITVQAFPTSEDQMSQTFQVHRPCNEYTSWEGMYAAFGGTVSYYKELVVEHSSHSYHDAVDEALRWQESINAMNAKIEELDEKADKKIMEYAQHAKLYFSARVRRLQALGGRTLGMPALPQLPALPPLPRLPSLPPLPQMSSLRQLPGMPRVPLKKARRRALALMYKATARLQAMYPISTARIGRKENKKASEVGAEVTAQLASQKGKRHGKGKSVRAYDQRHETTAHACNGKRGRSSDKQRGKEALAGHPKTVSDAN